MRPGPLPWETMDEHEGRTREAEPPIDQAAEQEGRSPETVQTGDARVDGALARLAELDDKPVGEHVAVVEDIHQVLQDALAEDED